MPHLSQRRPLVFLVLALLFVVAPVLRAYGPEELVVQPGVAAGAGDFSLVRGGRCVPVWVEPGAGEAVALAAADLAADLVRVSGAEPGGVAGGERPPAVEGILVGRLGGGGLVDRLAAAGKLDTGRVRGAWEAGVIQVVQDPLPGVTRAVVVAGSDVRGAVFSLYDLSQALGVSPWHWWADVPVSRNPAPAVRAGAHVRGEPAVRYRGIFINDEDWGLQPWAARTFEPGAGGLGPRTYEKVCELLLRLRANTLWPAMHACSPPFNGDPSSREVARRRGIVMGSSHAEPMLRNNVREWSGDPHSYDYVHNREGVLSYWEERVRSNAACESLWTLGMRGIHDSAMQGVKGVDEQRAALEHIFADQRALLDRHAPGGAAAAPQVFCAYKEVLEVYRSGLRVPEDVTLVWPDDNFGFIRMLPNAAEAARAGGNGVYYHLSYLGRPLSYLWLCTTPPSLVWEEMTRAWRAGARRLWVVNVGDIKPAEAGTEFFLSLAWDADRSGPGAARDFLRRWAAREFGADHAAEVAALMEAYHVFNYTRRPEHLQAWPSGDAAAAPLFDSAQAQARLSEARRLRAEAERLAALMPTDRADAFFELVLYPVRGSACANERYLALEEYARLPQISEAATAASARAWSAHRQLRADTHHYNEELLGGKWRHMISLEPADAQWKSMRLAPPAMPPEPASLGPVLSAFSAPAPVAAAVTDAAVARVRLELPSRVEAPWLAVPGLGRRGLALALLSPLTRTPAGTRAPAAEAAAAALTLELPAGLPAGSHRLHLFLLPTHPVRSGESRQLGVTIDGALAGVVDIPPADGGAEWSRAVLCGVRQFSLPIKLQGTGPHRLELSSADEGLVIDGVELE